MRLFHYSIKLLLCILFIICKSHIIVCVAEDSTSSSSSGSIVWDNYAISPRKCIYYNNQDIILFSMFDNGNTVCNGKAAGMYFADAPTFVASYLAQLQQDAQYTGNSYQEPVAASYLTCSLYKINGQKYYARLGCSPSSVHGLAVNIYSDNTCSTRASTSGDIMNVDLSGFSIPFRTCESCVNWFDVDDQNIDDQFYNKHKMESPMCSAAWTARQECTDQCKKISQDAMTKEDWTTTDKFILGFLSLFGIILIIGIIMQRQLMSKKDALMEEAAMTVAGIRKIHVVGLMVLFIIIILIFGLLKMKAVTWSMMLLTILVLFLYVVKLLVSGATEDPTIGMSNTSDEYSEFSASNRSIA